MTDFLLELRSEEIPARMQEKASADLARLFEAEIARAGLTASGIETYATPRRLALIARDLPTTTEAVREETKGPKSSAPPQALEGFLRKTGLTPEQLEERDGTFFAIVEKPGRATTEVLAEVIPAIVRAFPWPKSMRWGTASASTSSLRWVRPLQGIVALFGEMVVPFEIEGTASGAVTIGHRFHHPGPITIGSAADYAFKLRAAHVILDPAERRGIIEGAARALAEAKGLHVIPDAGLVAENAGLTEWPVPLLGDFDSAFLEVPREVIQLTLRTNQKYFVLADGEGKLAPAFLCTANIEAADGGAAIVAGNRKVLAARLSDARFFWEQDKDQDIKDLETKLNQIVYLDGLGTYWEKQYRVSKLATRIAASVENVSDFQIEQLETYLKADLVTATVGEFPEVQGVISAYLAALNGIKPEYAVALKGIYRNAAEIRSFGHDPIGNVLQVSDRLDNVVGFAAKDIWFKGSGDPFGIRQSAQAVVAALLEGNIRISARYLVWQSYRALVEAFGYNRDVFAVEKFSSQRGEIREVETPLLGAGIPDGQYKSLSDWDSFIIRVKPTTAAGLRAQLYFDQAIERTLADYAGPAFDVAAFASIVEKIVSLLVDRLKVQQREAGVRHDLIDAVFALGGEDDLVRLLARVKALQAFVGTEDGANLLAGYKRAANILRKEGREGPAGTPAKAGGHSDPSPEDEAAMDSPLRGNEDQKSKSIKITAASISLSYTPENAEIALIDALESAQTQVERAVAAERFEEAMGALAQLRGPIDAFFESVTVNDPVPEKREARLRLLAGIRSACHTVADFSKIEG